MTTGRPVLVVTDMQNGFVREQSAHIVPVVVDLVRRWQEVGGDTLFTRYFNYAGSPYERFFGWRKLQSSPETDVVSELLPFLQRGEMLDKTIYSPFTTEGEDLFAAKGWDDVYFCGIATESCVLKGAVDAFERNLRPWLIADASASHAGREAHDAGLLVARRFIGPGQVIEISDIPASLLAGQGGGAAL
ncbi:MULTISPECIES: cysteine hydrolase [unclassified Micromonospora]|uniref:cysteine hydrolase n=1 Tax=unclassified Micromonospora TaxID=2617518 RepID=UPI00098D57C1|nr:MULTISPECIES: cysteine hydrolase [unclassified Micromonospora]MDI5936969.1 cysteine hydrolase [Micromonospora sp. DH15]OON30142.1 hydrolase [Micromonospora sp. Rc5]